MRWWLSQRPSASILIVPRDTTAWALPIPWWAIIPERCWHAAKRSVSIPRNLSTIRTRGYVYEHMGDEAAAEADLTKAEALETSRK